MIKNIFIVIVLFLASSFYALTIWSNYIFWFQEYVDNNKKLNKYVTEFSNISHPSNTVFVSSHNGVRRPIGNGNNCHYFIAEIREFSDNRNQIKKFYLDRGIEIEFLEGNRFGKYNQPFHSPIPYGYHKLSKWKLSNKNLTTNLYLIFSLQVDFEKFDSMDLRCH